MHGHIGQVAQYKHPTKTSEQSEKDMGLWMNWKSGLPRSLMQTQSTRRRCIEAGMSAKTRSMSHSVKLQVSNCSTRRDVIHTATGPNNVELRSHQELSAQGMRMRGQKTVRSLKQDHCKRVFSGHSRATAQVSSHVWTQSGHCMYKARTWWARTPPWMTKEPSEVSRCWREGQFSSVRWPLILVHIPGHDPRTSW